MTICGKCRNLYKTSSETYVCQNKQCDYIADRDTASACCISLRALTEIETEISTIKI